MRDACMPGWGHGAKLIPIVAWRACSVPHLVGVLTNNTSFYLFFLKENTELCLKLYPILPIKSKGIP